MIAEATAGEGAYHVHALKNWRAEGVCRSLRCLQVDLHVPAVPDNFERLRSDYMVELHLKVMQHQLDQVS